MNKSLEQEMVALWSLRILKLKELLLAQALFHASISEVVPQDIRVSWFGLKFSDSVRLTI